MARHVVVRQEKQGTVCYVEVLRGVVSLDTAGKVCLGEAESVKAL